MRLCPAPLLKNLSGVLAALTENLVIPTCILIFPLRNIELGVCVCSSQAFTAIGKSGTSACKALETPRLTGFSLEKGLLME